MVNLISRRPAAEPVHEVLVNRSGLGATDVALFLASQLSKRWSASLLGGGHFQQRNDIDGDGWADLAGYSRGVARPRFFWNGGEGRAGFLTGGITYENREGGSARPYVRRRSTRAATMSAAACSCWFGSRYVVTVRFAASTQHHDHRFGEIRERDRHEMLFGEATIRGTNGRHTWVAGVAAEREAYRPLDVTRFAYRYITPGMFAQDDITVATWLSRVRQRARSIIRIDTALSSARGSPRSRAGAVGPAASPRARASSLRRRSPRRPRPRVCRGWRSRGRSWPSEARSASFDLTRSLGPVSATATLFASRVSHPIHRGRSDATG